MRGATVLGCTSPHVQENGRWGVEGERQGGRERDDKGGSVSQRTGKGERKRF